MFTNHEDRLLIGQTVYFKFKKCVHEGTIMAFEQEYSDKYKTTVSKSDGKVKIWGLIIDNGIFKRISVWRDQSRVRKKLKPFDDVEYKYGW